MEQHGAATLSVANTPVPPSRRRTVLVAAGVVAAIGTALLPFASVPGPAIPPFNAFYVACVVVIDLITAFLLFGQFRVSRWLPLAVLAGAYLFTGIIALVHLVHFSEFQVGLGVLTGRPQSAAYLWHAWHIGFPAFALVYVMAARRLRRHRIAQHQVARAAVLTVAAVAVLVLALTTLFTAFHDSLPLLHSGRTWNPITYHLGWVMGGLTLVALAGLWRDRAALSFVDLWLALALVAFFFDFTPNLLAGERFSLGWYVGRLSGLVAAGALLMLFLNETVTLYRRLGVQAEKLGHFNEELEAQVEERTTALRRALEERELLVREVHHRVNNNLQLISGLMRLELTHLSDPRAPDAVARIERRIATLGQIHRQLVGSGDLQRADLAPVLEDMAEGIRQRNPDARITVECDPLKAGFDYILPFGLLASEILGGATEARVAVAEDGGCFRLTVEAPAPPPESWKVISTLTAQMGGTIEQKGAGEQKGTATVIALPAPNA